MPAMNAQTAPQPKKPQAAPQPSAKKPEEKKGFQEKLDRLPQAAGIALMVLLIAVSIAVGNVRALQNATPKDFIRQGEVKSIIEDRLDEADNVRMAASRAEIDSLLLDEVEAAQTAMEKAKTARDISRADQNLTSAVTEVIDEASKQLSGENLRTLTKAADQFAEEGSFLRQEARAYNKKAQKAEKLYEKLLLRPLLAEPDKYEGI